MAQRKSAPRRGSHRKPLQPATVTLPAELGIETVRELYALLAPYAAHRERVTLQLRGVSRLHTAAFQVLAAFVRSRAAIGYTTDWRDPPRPLLEAAAHLGLGAALGLPAPSTY